MIHIYEKVCKTEDNIYGIQEVKENPFLNGPCILTMIALPLKVKDINGSLREVAKLVNPAIDNFYNPDCRLLGLSYGDLNSSKICFKRPSPSDEDIDEFVDKYLYSLFIEDNNKIDISIAMKNFRNLTILTYCNASKYYKKIEDKLINKMEQIGYNNDEIKSILSQICLACITGQNIIGKGIMATCVSFEDINDEDSRLYGNERIKDFVNDNGSYLFDSDPYVFASSGSGEHDYDRYMSGDEIISNHIKQLLNTSINNSIENKTNIEFVPISYKVIEEEFNKISSKTK